MKLSKDQKIAIGIAAASTGALILYRKHEQTIAATNTQTPVVSQPSYGQIAPYTPQNPVVLETGESVYDPNSGGLYSPTAPAATPTTPTATTPSGPNYLINVKYPKHKGARRGGKKPHIRKPSVHRSTNHAAKTAPHKTPKNKTVKKPRVKSHG